MKQKLIILSFTSLVLISCDTNKLKNSLVEENEDFSKAITEYCNCVEEKLNDSLTDLKLTDTYKKDCFKSIVDKKYHLAKEKELTKNFDSTKLIVQLNKSVAKKIEGNLSNLLVKNDWGTEVEMNSRYWEKRIVSFDGVIFTQELYRIYDVFEGSWQLKNSWSGKYTMVTEKNGETYVYAVYDDGEKSTFKLGKNSKNKSYLECGSMTLWKE